MRWKNHPLWALLVLMGLHVLSQVDRHILVGFSPQILQDLGLDRSRFGFLVGFAWVLSFGFMGLFLGSLADRHSRTRVIVGGLVVWSAATWASAHAVDYGQMVAGRLLVASGAAALMPAALSLISELFGQRQRTLAIGLYFVGIPLGVGGALLLAGSTANLGWRLTLEGLGLVGLLAAALLVLARDARGFRGTMATGSSFGRQLKALWAVLGQDGRLRHVTRGLVLLHLSFVSLSFSQLWLVNERGFTAAASAALTGQMLLFFGCLGGVAGSLLAVWLAPRLAGGVFGLVAGLVLICGPLALAFVLALPGSPLFHLGMAAKFFLPLAAYAAVTAHVLDLTPVTMRATMVGFVMMCMNLVALAGGSLVAGLAVDWLAAQGVAQPFTPVLLVVDTLVLCAAAFFLRAARLDSRQRLPR